MTFAISFSKSNSGAWTPTTTSDAEDERSVRVSLTEAGRQLREKAFDYREITARAAGLSPEEFRTLQKAIVNLRTNLMDAASPPA